MIATMVMIVNIVMLIIKNDDAERDDGSDDDDCNAHGYDDDAAESDADDDYDYCDDACVFNHVVDNNAPLPNTKQLCHWP